MSVLNDIKQFDGKALALEIWGMWSTPSLLSLSGPLWPGVVAPNRVLSMCQIEQTVCKQMTDINLWLSYSNIWNHVTVCKKKSQARLRMLSTKCVYESYIYIYLYIYPFYTGKKSEFRSHWGPHLKGLVPRMFSYESNKLETYIYTTCM